MYICVCMYVLTYLGTYVRTQKRDRVIKMSDFGGTRGPSEGLDELLVLCT
jgi:hypothetical protein